MVDFNYVGADPYYIYADQIDTPRVITDTNNLMVWRWDQTDPFGAMLPDENPTSLGTFTYNLRFPGQVYDAETGKHYNVNRDYDPAGGRYVQSDPIGLNGGQWSTYSYVRSNPVSRIDPKGLLEWTGEIVSFGVAVPAGPGGMVITYTMTSKCVRGQKWIVKGQAIMGAMGIGKTPISTTTTSATFEDGLDYANPYTFNGPALTYSVGSVALGGGTSLLGHLQLGAAVGDVSGSQSGLDATLIQSALGVSSVFDVSSDSCGCK